MTKTAKSVKQRDDTSRIIAEKVGVSISYVQKIRNGRREVDSDKAQQVMDLLTTYQRGKSKLISSLEELIPVESNPSKYAR